MEAAISQLRLPMLKDLSESLLEFETVADVETWLSDQKKAVAENGQAES
ncbi:DUF4351 domain-containing protein [Leptothoe sp. PORK10 BA2]|nr:DUF4351 domain-containing protein [Leptothoe sp. PORK10 BA2]MEA5465711.1 DUF4351 domain-containing protein [Leptothoe sp. PORK10 BA2]